MKTYKGKISNLDKNQIFVFGSNPVGIQGAGAALFAVKKGWCSPNEKMNNCISSSGKSYGIVTIQYPGKKRSKTLQEITENIHKLYKYAIENNNKEFLIAYTGSGRNLNGYSNKEMASCFASTSIPPNVIFEEQFFNIIKCIS